jgi:hypothetical protein
MVPTLSVLAAAACEVDLGPFGPRSVLSPWRIFASRAATMPRCDSSKCRRLRFSERTKASGRPGIPGRVENDLGALIPAWRWILAGQISGGFQPCACQRSLPHRRVHLKMDSSGMALDFGGAGFWPFWPENAPILSNNVATKGTAYDEPGRNLCSY